MNYQFKGSFIQYGFPENIPSLLVEWYNGNNLIYKRTFFGSIAGNEFNLVYRERFDFDRFRNFIADIKNNTETEFNLFEINNTSEWYKYNHNAKKLEVSFWSYENGMEVYFDVNDSFIKLLEDMVEKINEYYHHLTK